MNRRRTITMLRCGCLPLEVETGRYRTPKTPLQQRICQLCENHCPSHCSEYSSTKQPHTSSMLIFIHSPLTRRLSLSYSYAWSPLLQVNLYMICLSYANICWNANPYYYSTGFNACFYTQSPACPPSLLLLLPYLL